MGVLVTGGAGFIGSHMVLDLLDAGEDVLVVDNLSTGFRWAVPDEAKFIEGDVGDHNLVRRLLLRNSVDAILHFAGSIVVPDSIKDPLGYYSNNTCKSRSLIACATRRRRTIFALSRSGTSMSLAPIPRDGVGNRRRWQRTSSKSRRKRRSANGLVSKSTAPTIRHLTAHASATISTSATSPARISMRFATFVAAVRARS